MGAQGRRGSSGSSRPVRRCLDIDLLTTGVVRLFPARAAVLHIGEGRPGGSTPSFPHDYGVFLECWFSVDGLPCAERAPLHMGGFQRR